MSNVGAEAGSDTLNATGINDGSIGAEPTVQAESSYRRGRDFERWAYSNRTVRLVQYMGPRFVRHHSTGQFVDLVFEDCYGSEGYYLVQNAYIGLKIYDDGTVMYDPDMESVAVEEERIMVQVYDNVSSTWKTLNLGVPFLNVDVNNVSEIVVTRVQNCSLGMLEVSYVVKSGELMKYDIAFTSYSLFQGLFKVVQELSGIQGSDVTYERTDGSDDTLIVNASKELLAPFLSFERDGTPVLTVSLQDLGHRDVTGEWTSDVLEKIILVNNTDGVKAEIVIGDFNLRWKEALSIDPLVTTIHVMHNDDDTYVEYWYDERASGYENNRAETLIHLGRHYSEHWDPVWEEWHHVQFFYRIFLRWPILIPDGGIVQSAYLNVCVSASPSYDFTANIRTLDNPNCSAFTASGSTIYYYGVMANTTNWQISGSWEEGK